MSWVTDCAVWAEALTAPTLEEAILALSPTGYWKLDESAGGTAADSSGNGRTGTYSGVTLGGVAGPDAINYASFDGSNDNVAIADNAVWSITGSGFSVFFAIHPDTFSSQFVMGKELDSSNTEWLVQLGAGAGGLAAFTRSTGLNNLAASSTTSNHLSSAAWNTVLITWTNATTPPLIYVNGALRTTSPTTGPGAVYTPGAADVNLGGVARLPSSFRYDGGMAHVAIWDSTLDSTQAGTLMLAGTAGGWS